MIALYWRRREPRFVESMSEPRCFACHFYPFEGQAPENIRRGWQKDLQRCHIIAASEGGSNNPENFLILCEDCHREAPMVMDSATMIKWVLNHETNVSVFVAEITEAMKEFRLEEVATLWRPEDHEAYQQFMRDQRLSFHTCSKRRDRIRGIVFLAREFIESRRFEQPRLFVGNDQPAPPVLNSTLEATP
jgi:hypothetical protein